jgi:hypothetical protein
MVIFTSKCYANYTTYKQKNDPKWILLQMLEAGEHHCMREQDDGYMGRGKR